MKLIHFHIELDKDGGIYEPGEEVSGRVLVNLEEPDVARAIKLNIDGDCSVHWVQKTSKEDEAGRTVTKKENFKGHEKYISLTQLLVGSETKDATVKLPAGQNAYPFSFHLPYEIPSSFEYKYGYVRYTLKAVIDRPLAFNNETTTRITVLSQFDLNMKPAAMQEIDDDDTVVFCYFCFARAGNMDLRIIVPASGYVPGQNIDVKIYFENRSDVNIRKVQLHLTQTMTFRVEARAETKTAEIILRKQKRKGPFGKKNEMIMSILVPPVPPSNLENCKLIDIEYNLLVILTVSGVHCNTRKTYPILIGTVPLSLVPLDVSPALVLPEEKVPRVSHSSENNDQPIPKKNQPIQQDDAQELHNDQPRTDKKTADPNADKKFIDPMSRNSIETPSTVQPSELNTKQIGFVIPPESPPHTHNHFITKDLWKDQNQESISVPDKN